MAMTKCVFPIVKSTSTKDAKGIHFRWEHKAEMVEGYTDGKFYYNKVGTVWVATHPKTGTLVTTAKTRKMAQTSAHALIDKIEKIERELNTSVTLGLLDKCAKAVEDAWKTYDEQQRKEDYPEHFIHC